MADADTTDFDVDAEAPGGGVREDTATDADEADDQEERLVAEGEIAGDYLEELLDVLDFDGDHRPRCRRQSCGGEHRRQ